MRFIAVSPELDTHCGLLGISSNLSRYGRGGKALVRATNAIFTSFATRHPNTDKATLLRSVRRSLRAKCHMVTVDAAADEVLAAELMRRPLMTLFGVLTPNCQIVLRDKAHASRRTAV